LHSGEEFADAAAREVWEETGVRAEFQEILTVRHSHNVQFGRSDIYVICRLKALSQEIKVDSEIDDAKWMPVDEFKANNKHLMLGKVCDIVSSGQRGLKEETMKSAIPGRDPFKLYYPY
jgi:8-oxo-dGTP pyrophosphatase MutT (NUDIX family)